MIKQADACGCRRYLTKGKTAEVMDIPQDLLLVVQLRTV